MIQGVIASESPALGAGGGGTIPAGSLVFLDFMTRTYAINEVAVTVDAVIDRAELVGAAGLQLRYDDELSPGTELCNLLGDALAAVLTMDWTIVVEYDVPDDSYQTQILVTGNHSTNYTQMDHGGPFDPHYFFFFDDRTAFDSGIALSTGINRAAVTRTDARRAMSVNGQAVVTDERDSLTPPTGSTATFGGSPDNYLFNEFNVRSFTLYAAQLDAALPGLSTP